jgi:hypothetical protein
MITIADLNDKEIQYLTRFEGITGLKTVKFKSNKRLSAAEYLAMKRESNQKRYAKQKLRNAA